MLVCNTPTIWALLSLFLSQNWYVFLQGGTNGTIKTKGD